MSGVKLTVLTLCVLVAFAANSVLGRIALKSSELQLIDPATYSAIRIACGALALTAIVFWRRQGRRRQAHVHSPEGIVAATRTGRVSLASAVALFLYAACFSFAYIQLNAAAGTLILFAAVQFTMLTGAAVQGHRFRTLELLGSLVAFAGLVWLLSPSVSDASLPLEALLMAISGIAWGIYSLIGKGSKDPITDTAGNFVLATPLALILCGFFSDGLQITKSGCALAATSGAVTSGLGYVLWYTVLPRLTSPQAAAVQLSVPVVAGLGGLLFAGDAITFRTIVAGGVILSGIAMTIKWRSAA